MAEDKYVNVWVNPYDDSLKAYVGRWQHNDIRVIAKDIIDKLKITQNDKVLDLCCGNGLITKIVAHSCQETFGVDFSEILIKQAKEKNSAPNIHYYLDDALNIDKLFPENFFDKIYCYFSFQLFSSKNGRNLIDLMVKVTKRDGLILIGDIPDKRKRWNFYNTGLKRIAFFIQKIMRKIHGEKGEDGLGWWWESNRIKKICKKLNVKCEILQQDKKLPHAHYRFDVLIRI